METTTINLTDKQSDLAEHVVDDIVTAFQNQHETGEITEMPPLPILEGCILTIPSHETVIAALLFTLEEDTPASDDAPSARPALALANKIRAVTGFAGLPF